MNLGSTIYVITWCFIKNIMCNVHLHYAVIDEVDSILIDEARTPLIISGQAGKTAELYMQANAFVRMLKIEEDYSYDESTKGVTLTESGIEKAKKHSVLITYLI